MASLTSGAQRLGAGQHHATAIASTLTSGNAVGAGSYDLPVEPGVREGREALIHWAELLGGDKVDLVVNLSGDQHQVDAFLWANFPLKPLPERPVG
jgi:hypothetical protein